MRNPGAAARIEHAEPLGNAHRSAVGIDDTNPSVPALEEGAHAARDQNEDERAGETDPKPVHNRGQGAHDDRIAIPAGLAQRRQKGGVEPDFLRDLLRPVHDAEQRHRGQQHGESEQHRSHASVIPFYP